MATTEWTLQYAPLRQSTVAAGSSAKRMLRPVIESPVEPPMPIEKEFPEFPAEILASTAGRVVAVYGIVTAEGRAEELRILQSPDSLLNQSVLNALGKWKFRPAKRNGVAIAVRSLLKIPLPAPS